MSSPVTQACATHAGQRSTTATRGRLWRPFVMHGAARNTGCGAVHAALASGVPASRHSHTSCIWRLPELATHEDAVQLTVQTHGARSYAVASNPAHVPASLPDPSCHHQAAMRGQRMSAVRRGGSVSPTSVPRVHRDFSTIAVAMSGLKAPA